MALKNIVSVAAIVFAGLLHGPDQRFSMRNGRRVDLGCIITRRNNPYPKTITVPIYFIDRSSGRPVITEKIVGEMIVIRSCNIRKKIQETLL